MPNVIEPKTGAPIRESVEAAQRVVVAARASIEAKVDELGRRVRATTAKIELRERVIAHPWPAVGIAAAAGLLLGVIGKSRSRRAASARSANEGVMPERTKQGRLGALLGVVAMPLMKRGAMALWQRYGQERSDIDEPMGMGEIPSMPSDPIPSRVR